MDAEKRRKREKVKGGGKSGEEKTPVRDRKCLPGGVETDGEGKPLCGGKRLPGGVETDGEGKPSRGKHLPGGVETDGEGKPSRGKHLPDRNAKGRFVKGNTAAGKYREEYGDAMLGYFKSSREEVPYPTFEEFAETLGVTVDTLLNWADKYDRFRNCYARAKNIQKGITLQGGMIGVYNQNIVKFMAINNFGMVDKVQTENKLRFEITMPADVDEESD